MFLPLHPRRVWRAYTLVCPALLRQGNPIPAYNGYTMAEMDAACAVCTEGVHEELLLLCEGHCGTASHTYCLGLPGVPEEAWFCSACVRRRNRLQRTRAERDRDRVRGARGQQGGGSRSGGGGATSRGRPVRKPRRAVASSSDDEPVHRGSRRVVGRADSGPSASASKRRRGAAGAVGASSVVPGRSSLSRLQAPPRAHKKARKHGRRYAGESDTPDSSSQASFLVRPWGRFPQPRLPAPPPSTPSPNPPSPVRPAHSRPSACRWLPPCDPDP